MSRWEDFKKWADTKAFTSEDAYIAAWTVWNTRQPEIDALKAALSKSNANMELVERDLYLKINELEDEVERLKAEKRMWFDRHEALKDRLTDYRLMLAAAPTPPAQEVEPVAEVPDE